jgi:hypothetical protein
MINEALFSSKKKAATRVPLTDYQTITQHIKIHKQNQRVIEDGVTRKRWRKGTSGNRFGSLRFSRAKHKRSATLQKPKVLLQYSNPLSVQYVSRVFIAVKKKRELFWGLVLTSLSSFTLPFCIL